MFQLFRKRKDALILILTSSDIKRTRRAYNSIKNSKKSMTIDIEIIVNSLDKNYINEVIREFKKDKLIITETPSDGGCGKGKNSVLEHFRHHKNNYDYLMQFDADDFLYPTAFLQFEKMLAKGPDILGLQASDILIHQKDERAENFFEQSQQKGNEFLHPITKDYFLHSWNNKELNLNQVFPKNVFEKISEQYPPDRILFLSANILKNERDLMVTEKIRKFTDYAFSVHLYEKAINKNYSYAHFSNSYCYVYDRANKKAVSSTYESFNQSREFFNQKFPEIIKDAVEKCDHRIDFSIIPHFKLGEPENFTLNDKIEFLKKNIV